MGLIKVSDIVAFFRPIHVNYIVLEFAIETVRHRILGLPRTRGFKLCDYRAFQMTRTHTIANGS
jgi:acetolactate synthase regulatory subunit